MERHEDLEEEYLVLLFEREGEPVDDRSQDLQQLRHPVVPFSLVHEPVEDVVDLKRKGRLIAIQVHNLLALPSHLLANVGPEPEEFPVDPVESRLQEVPLARVLRVEQIEQVQDELLVDVPLHQRWLRDVNLRISLGDPIIAG